MSKFTKIAIAATLATTVIATSMSAAQAGKRNHARDIGLGVIGAIVGAAIINESHKRSHRQRRYARDCWWERQEVWSEYRGRYVIRKVKVCD